MSNLSKEYNRELLQFGSISGLTAIFVFVVIYVLGSEYFLSPIVWISSFGLPIVFAVLAARAAKKNGDGYLAFSGALKVSFGVFVLTGLISTLFSFIMFNYIDVAFGESVKQLTIEKTMEFMERFKVPETEIDKQIDQLVEMDMFSIKNLFKSFAQSCIVYFIEALILAAILKKKKPEIEFGN